MRQGLSREDRQRARWRRPFSVRVANICLLLIPALLPPARAADEALEYQVKAAMIYNFAKFVRWPDGEAAGKPLVVGVLGDDPFDGSLELALAGRSVFGSPVQVRNLDPSHGPFDCDVLFVGRSERRRIPQVLEQVRGRAVLTISDIDEFASAGGMIGFVIEDGRIRFEVNLDAARRAGLQISSKLLRLATGQRQTEARKR